jgi:uncharacterized lipoprotein YmbA
MNTARTTSLTRFGYPATAFAAFVLTACASTPTRYYTLVDPASNSEKHSSSQFLIDVQPVRIPAQVDQPQLVVRTDDGGVQLLEHERWIAPLADELRTALSANLVRELDAIDVADQPPSSAGSILRIRVDFQRLDSVPGHYVSLDATWSVAAAERPALVCGNRIYDTVAPGYDGMVRGQRLLLNSLVSRIAAAARPYTAGTSHTCPADSDKAP